MKIKGAFSNKTLRLKFCLLVLFFVRFFFFFVHLFFRGCTELGLTEKG